MANANIDDRASIERIYPAEDFARDAVGNGAPAEVLRGVRILSAPNEAGDFDVEPARQQVGEIAGAVFLPARGPAEELVDRGVKQVAPPDPDAGYRGFIDDIIAAAKQFGFARQDSPGPGDARLRGLRQ